jgi:hypothetical protein
MGHVGRQSHRHLTGIKLLKPYVASVTSIPLYAALHLYSVVFAIPCWQYATAVFSPGQRFSKNPDDLFLAEAAASSAASE